MLNEANYLRIVRASAIYDLVVTAPFATPWTAALITDWFRQIHARLGLSGTLPVLDPTHIFFANLMGTVVLIWSVVRLHLNMPVLGRYDAAGRMLFSAWMLYGLAAGMSRIVVPLLIVEIAFGVLQLLPYKAVIAKPA